jgi:hypothetical protein
MHQKYLCPLFFLGLGILACSGPIRAQECENLLVPDFEFYPRDIATDLSYLAVISPANFANHRKNADRTGNQQYFQANTHLGLDLPIASALLLASATYDEFNAKREQKYQEYHFKYPAIELSNYYTQVLPEPRASAYDQCTRVPGFHAQITKTDRDFVEVQVSWRAAGPASDAVIAKTVVEGGAADSAMPTKLKPAQKTRLLFTRNLDKEFRFTAAVNGAAVSLFTPRYMNAEPAVAASTARCANAAKVVHAVYRQILETDIEPAQLPHVTSLLDNNVNSVRQLVERLLIGADYTRKFVKEKSDLDTLRALYRHVLARESDAAGLTYNSTQLRTLGFQETALAFAQGNEYQQRFGEWGVPGTTPPIKYCSKK